MQTDEILPKLESAFLKSQLSQDLQSILKFCTLSKKSRCLTVAVGCLEDLIDIASDSYSELFQNFCDSPDVQFIVYECSEKRWKLPGKN